MSQPYSHPELHLGRSLTAGASVALSALALLLHSAMARAGTPVLAINEDEINNSLNVFYASAAVHDTLEEIYVPGSGPNPSGFKRVTGLSGRPSLASPSFAISYDDYILGHPQVIYLAQSAQGTPYIEQLWNTSMTPLDLTSSAHAQPPAEGTTLVGYDDECAGTDNVFFVGSDQHIHHLYYKNKHGWVSEDVTKLSGGGKVEGIEIAGHEALASEEVFYLEADGHVHELWRWSSCRHEPGFDGWHHTDVTLANANGAPAALSGSPLTSFFDPNGAMTGTGVYASSGTLDAVLYVDVHHHLQELYFTTEASWKHLDLTTQSGAPTVSPGTALASQAWLYQSDGFFAAFEDVYFIDSKANIWEVSSAFEGTDSESNAGAPYDWTAANAAKAAKATAAGSGTPLRLDINDINCPACDSGGFRKEITYVGTDDHVHSLGEYMFDMIGWTVYDMTKGTGAPDAVP
jgi:hypothetical protein